MRLLLIRHAEPVRVEATSGIANPPLNDTGRAQADLLARWLAQERIDHVASSPLARALETAAPLATAVARDVEVVPGLAEFDSTSSSYIPMEELRANRDPRLEALVTGRWDELGSDVRPEDFRERVLTAMTDLVAAHPGENVAAVCHGAVINLCLGDIIGTRELLWFEPKYTSISRVLVSRNGIRTIESVNEASHLRGGLG